MSEATPAEHPGHHRAPSLVDLQAEVVAAREELVASLDELRSQTEPKAMLARGGRAVLGVFTDEYGGIRPERVAIAAVVTIGVLALVFRRRR
jgi:hypothetical protein